MFGGSTVVAVGSAIDPPAGADVVDLGDATLLPGLIDTHVHLAFDASADPVAGLAERDDAAVTAAMSVAGRAAVRGGITTVRDLGDRSYLSLGLRATAHRG
jgi:imidazolonepropionase-like amidohydrolase